MDTFWYAFLATLFCWAVTTLGAAVVLCFRSVGQKTMDAMLGFGGGVMVASAFFSLILPAVETAQTNGQAVWLHLSLGFASGALIIFLSGLWLDRRCRKYREGAGRRRGALLVFAVTLHNIPEGLAVGVAFGAALTGSGLAAAALLALGIGIQNFPEGAAVSLPLCREGMKRSRAFVFGSLSGAAEPVAGCVGFLAAALIQGILPFVLSLAAGCMIAVAFAEVIPECTARSRGVGFWGLCAGFLVMMMLDVLL